MNCERCGTETSADGLCSDCLEIVNTPVSNVPSQLVETAIVLLGKPNSGKTSTLVLAYHDLLAEGRLVSGGQKIKEVHAVIEIGGVNVGITSKCDIAESLPHPDEELGEKLADLVSQNCAVIICAARNSKQSKTAIAVVETLEPDYQIIWIDKEQNRPETDRPKANEIMALVRNAIPVLT